MIAFDVASLKLLLFFSGIKNRTFITQIYSRNVEMYSYNPQLTKQLREKSDLTQYQLANLLDLRDKQIQRYETGQASPHWETIGILYEMYRAENLTSFPLMINENGAILAIPIGNTPPAVSLTQEPVQSDLLKKIMNLKPQDYELIEALVTRLQK